MADALNTQCCGNKTCPREGSKCACTNCKCSKGECLPNCKKLCCADAEKGAQGKCGNAGCKCGAACKCSAGSCASGCKKGCCAD